MKLPWLSGSERKSARISVEERRQISELHSSGASITEIARTLKRSRAAIYRALDAEEERARVVRRRKQREMEDELMFRVLTDRDAAQHAAEMLLRLKGDQPRR